MIWRETGKGGEKERQEARIKKLILDIIKV